MHSNHRKRMRNRYYKAYLSGSAVDGFADHEILEMFLFYAIPRQDTNPIAHRLMREFGSLNGVFSAHVDDLVKVEGVGPASAMLISMLKPIYEKAFLAKNIHKKRLPNIQAAGEYCVSVLQDKKEEQLYIICLDSNFRVLFSGPLQKGSISSLPIYHRHIVEICIRYNASCIILAHNHPGGHSKPSRQDVEITKDIMSVLAPLEVTLIDHFIIADGNYYSFFGNMKMDDKKESKAVDISASDGENAGSSNKKNLIAAQDTNLLID